MQQHPAIVWNRIAETQTLRTEWAQAMFPLDDDQLASAMERQMEALTPDLGDRLASVYLTIMPLLWEAQAILDAQAAGVPLVDSVTAMETVQEAVIAASRDYALTTKEQKRLEAKLQTPPAV